MNLDNYLISTAGKGRGQNNFKMTIADNSLIVSYGNSSARAIWEHPFKWRQYNCHCAYFMPHLNSIPPVDTEAILSPLFAKKEKISGFSR